MHRSTRIACLAVAAAVVVGFAGPAGARESRDGGSREGSRTGERDGSRTQSREGAVSKTTGEAGAEALARRADAAIGRRLETLAHLVKKVESADDIRSADRTSLLDVLHAQQAGLTALRTKIAAETDADALGVLVRSIALDYRVYMLTVPKVRLVLAANKLLGAASTLEDAAAKLQAKVDGLPEGDDATAGQAAIDAMLASVAKGRSLVEGVPASVIPLQTKDYPGNRDELAEARQALKSGASTLREARKQAHSALELIKKAAAL